jgi:MFS family permease
MTDTAVPARDQSTAESARSRRNALTGAYLGWMFDGYETFATVLVASTLVNDLVGPGTSLAHPIYVGAVLAITLVAWAIGGLSSGILADRFGRRRVLMVSILWYAVCAGLTALAPSFGIYLVLRFLTGIGMGAEWGGGSSLVAETAVPAHRGRRMAFLQAAFGVGFLIATGLWQVVNTGDPGDWRWMYVIGVVPALLVLFIRKNVEDSKMWKESDRKRRQAESAVASGSADQHDEILARTTFSQLLSLVEYRKRAAVLLVAALGSMVGWWAVSTWIPAFAAATMLGRVDDLPTSITLVVLSYNAAGVIGYLVMGWLADVLGRKPTIALFFLMSAALTPFFFTWPDTRNELIVAAFVNGFFTLGQMTWLALYPSELFPTNIRATGMSLVFNLARFPAALGALITPTLISAFGSIATAAIVIGCCGYGLGLLITPVLGPETKGQPLPDVDALLEPSGEAA